MRVMLDTNIIISYILFNNDKMSMFFNHVLNHNSLVMSNIIIGELQEVFKKKFPNKMNTLHEFLDDLETEMIIVDKLYDDKIFSIRDSKDYLVLYAGIKGNVDVFVTGDADFKNVEIKKPKIMTMNEYIMKYIL